LLRDDQYAFIQYKEDASGGIELYDIKNDPQQFTNLATDPKHKSRVNDYKTKMQAKLAAVRDNDL
jgi:iduronate 2-sulfatase